jgi:Dyp-type peroxidase family
VAPTTVSSSLELGDIQGLVIRGYSNLPAARFGLFEIGDRRRARAWLAAVADAVTSGDERPADRAINVALSATGLGKLDLAPEAMAGFSSEFVEGMTTDRRARILGDVEESAPQRWQWGGPNPPGIDLILLVYARDEEHLAGAWAEVEPGDGGVTLVHALDSWTHSNREHFGFRDGISQPTLEGLARVDSAANTIKAGEFVLGYPNEYGLLTDRPLLDRDADPDHLLPAADGRADFGRNGSYLVLRQLAQDVPKFWQFIDRQVGGVDSDRVRLAAKMVGRWPGGASLVESPDHDIPSLARSNDFGYHAGDTDGLRCPHGAHVRRSHPRDSLDPRPGSKDSIAVSKRHRILRRGRPYGDPISMHDALAAGDDPAAGARGLFFMCLNGNIARQFEFIQHTWINNPKFAGLYDDADALTGTDPSRGRTFRIPAFPVRKRITEIPTFVTVRGGAYFFLPGIAALRYLTRSAG